MTWTLARLGRPYQFFTYPVYNPHDIFDFYSNQWYCSELVWAAYYNQDIDIAYYISPLGIKIDDDVKMYQNIPPVSNINLSSSKVEVNRSAFFDFSDSYDADGAIVRYYIDFGDGTNESSDGIYYPSSSNFYTSHVYKKSGRYKLHLL
ncbi:MAG TPA: PKD domain-containing protein [Thermoplasmatales archaeon]|nr:PKD domain-containing protein [Thermoplasmatales archaeon]